jgi:hypothetical protein
MQSLPSRPLTSAAKPPAPARQYPVKSPKSRSLRTKRPVVGELGYEARGSVLSSRPVGWSHLNWCRARAAYLAISGRGSDLIDTGIGQNQGVIRDVVLGRNSAVWLNLVRIEAVAQHIQHVIGHRELESFDFTPADRVWVLSYSRNVEDNQAIFRRLRAAGVREVVYVSSSSTIVNRETSCYEYPRVKGRAETHVLTLPQARVLTIGMMYSDERELPAGDNISTHYDELAEFMLAPRWPVDGARRKLLFRVVSRPFANRMERGMYRLYGHAMDLVRSRPCLLRPADLVLRMLRMRWYGYTYSSNRLWISTMS